MRYVIALLVALVALPVAAGDGFSLGLAEMGFSVDRPDAVADDQLVLVAGADGVAGHDETLVYQAALTPRTPNERVLALWDSDLGRVHAALAAEYAMLGRQGLVHGGRMAGLGLATAGIGDGNPNGALGLALGRGRWAEMNANEKLQAGVEATILGALIAFMISNAD